MKFTLLLMAASTQAIMLEEDLRWDGPYTVNSADDEGFEVPKQELSRADNPWGHEVERVGHQDWLDKGVHEWKTNRGKIPPYDPAENRVAVPDS